MRLVIAAAPFLASLARAQACPEIPDTGVHIGDPVPMRPEDIPEGCSDYEVLVGM